MLNSLLAGPDDFGYRHIWRVSLPIIVGGAAQVIVNVTDSLLLGHYTADPYAFGAAALAVLFFINFVFVGWGFAIGAQIIMARAKGEGDIPRIGQTYYQTLFFLLGFSLLTMAICLFGADIMLKPFIQDPNIYNDAKQYLIWRSFGSVFVLASITFRALCIGTSITWPITVSIFVLAITNYFFNDALIFGKYGFPEMGLSGSALGTNIAEAISALVFFLIISLHPSFKAFGINNIPKPNWGEIKRILNTAGATMVQMFFSIVSWFLFFSIVEKLGKQALDISNLIRNIYMIMMIPLMGFNAVAATLVSELIGVGKEKDIFKLLNKLVLLSLGCTVVASAFNLAFIDFLPSLFVKDAALVEATEPSSILISFSILLFCVAILYFSGVSGTGNTQVALVIEFFTISIYLLSAHIFANVLNWGVTWAWAAEFVYFSILLIISVWYLRSGKWIGRKV